MMMHKASRRATCVAQQLNEGLTARLKSAEEAIAITDSRAVASERDANEAKSASVAASARFVDIEKHLAVVLAEKTAAEAEVASMRSAAVDRAARLEELEESRSSMESTIAGLKDSLAIFQTDNHSDKSLKELQSKASTSSKLDSNLRF